ncbi:Retrovirus-related Pol polyprotein from transposon 412, partial [Frankliniella fusca]
MDQPGCSKDDNSDEDAYGRRTLNQVVLPRGLIPRILEMFHDRPGAGGHLGHNKTVARIRAHYYWVGLVQELHDDVRERADMVSWRMKERYDLRAKRPNIQAGDRVWLYDPRRRVGFATKLGSWWTGPYVVLAAINDVCFRIRKLDQPRARPSVVHADRLTPLVSMSRRAGS